ncbi:MAG: GFA family protein [Micropepsaceae bacterium]
MAVHGSCHCGKTRFELAAQPAEITSCTCSYCAKSGALWAYCTPEDFRLLTPEGDRALYQFNSRTIQHFFCDACGVATYGISPEWVDFKPDFSRQKFAVNARLLDDVDIGLIPVTVIDGKNLW